MAMLNNQSVPLASFALVDHNPTMEVNFPPQKGPQRPGCSSIVQDALKTGLIHQKNTVFIKNIQKFTIKTYHKYWKGLKEHHDFTIQRISLRLPQDRHMAAPPPRSTEFRVAAVAAVAHNVRFLPPSAAGEPTSNMGYPAVMAL